MKTTFYLICKKNGWILLAVFLCFVIMKAAAVYTVHDLKTGQKEIDGYVSQCSHKDLQQIQDMISDLQTHYLTGTGGGTQTPYVLSKLFRSFKNAQDVSQLISFSHERIGSLPSALPYHYLDALGFYQKLAAPQVINETYLDIYFQLQQYSVVTILAILLSSCLWGKHYETEMDKYAAVTKKGKSYHRTITLFVVLVVIFLLLVNELFDLIYSGTLWNASLFNASVQSYSPFAVSQITGRIGDCVLWSFCSKVINAMLACQITFLMAKIRKNTRNTIVCSFGILLTCFFVSNALQGTRFYPLIQLGMIDWKEAIQNTTLCFGMTVPMLYVGFGLLLLLELIYFFPLVMKKCAFVFHRK